MIAAFRPGWMYHPHQQLPGADRRLFRRTSASTCLRRYWGDRPQIALERMIHQLAEKADALCGSCVIPRILRPISEAIASRS